MAESQETRRQLLSLIRAFLECRPGAANLVVEDPALNQAADRHGLLGLAATQAMEAGGANLEAARAVVQSYFLANCNLKAQLEKFAPVLAEAGLAAMVFKGAAMLFGVYAEHLTVRPNSDADLLVPEHQLEQARNALGDFDRRSGEVDFHYHPVAGERSRRSSVASTIFFTDLDSLWNRADQHLDGLYLPADEDHLLLVSLHFLKNSHQRFINLLDCALLADRIGDWRALWQRAAETRTERALGYSLRLLERLLDCSWAEAHAGLPRLNSWESSYLNRVVEGRQPDYEGKLLWLLAADGATTQLALLKELLSKDEQQNWRQMWQWVCQKLSSGG